MNLAILETCKQIYREGHQFIGGNSVLRLVCCVVKDRLFEEVDSYPSFIKVS